MDSVCINGCKPIQILNINKAISNKDNVSVYNKCGKIYTDIEYSYSVDGGVCWSCWLNEQEFKETTLNLSSDYLLRIKIPGDICKVTVNCGTITDYSTSLYSGFTYPDYTNTNVYNPYANLEGALQLQQTLTETVSNIVGIPIYYLRVVPDSGSKDLTFKEYALKSVESVKQIKLIVTDGKMPSSKPEFTEWDLDWQSDWECEIAMNTFYQAFGRTAKPMEGDLIYIPLMKRMWTVNQSYIERSDSLMWQATTFKVTLVKYQVDDSVDLNDHQDFVDNIVSTKYEDLFGSSENNDSSINFVNNNQPTYDVIGNEYDIVEEDITEVDLSEYNNLIPVYEYEYLRKYASKNDIEVVNKKLYCKGLQVAEYFYNFNTNASIIYQQQFCGEDCSLSFILNLTGAETFKKKIISIGKYKGIFIEQTRTKINIWSNFDTSKKLSFNISNDIYLVSFRWSRSMNLYDAFVYKYTFPDNLPLYKLQPHHYYFDIDNPVVSFKTSWSNEFEITKKSDVVIHSFNGMLTNIKIFQNYNDNIQEIMMEYPTNKLLLINDTASPFVNSNGQMIK